MQSNNIFRRSVFWAFLLVLTSCTLINSSDTSSTSSDSVSSTINSSITNSISSSTSSSITSSIESSSSSSSSTVQPYSIESLEEALANFGNTNSVKIDYSAHVTSRNSGAWVYTELIAQNIDNKPIMVMKAKQNQETIEMYFVDNYIYLDDGTNYSVSLVDEYEISEETPIPVDLDFSDLEFDFQSGLVDDKIIYTVVITDDDIRPYIEELVGSSVEDMDFTMTYEFSVIESTRELASMKINFTFNLNNVTYNFEMIANITLGYTGTIFIPLYVTERIELYKVDPTLVHNVEYFIEPISMVEPDPHSNPRQNTSPKPAIYNDTEDGVVKIRTLNAYSKVIYDEYTNQLITINDSSIEIYNANTLEVVRTITSQIKPTCIDVDDGKLAVAYQSSYFNIYDLTTESEPTTYTADVDASEIAIDDDLVIYSGLDPFYRSITVFYNLATGEKKVNEYYYHPIFTMNHKEHIVYFSESGLSSSTLVYFDTKTGEKLYESVFSQFTYVSENPVFDGTYLHHDGKTIDPINGTTISTNGMNRKYHLFIDFTPYETLYDNGEIALVSSTDYKLAVYDNVNQTYIYQYYFPSQNVIALKDGRLLALGINTNKVAVIDPRLITEDYINDAPFNQMIDVITTSEDDKVMNLRTTRYTSCVVDENYIYTINSSSYRFNVYDIKTLKKVYSEDFMIRPNTIDANNGKVVIGFDAYLLRIYDTTTWEYTNVQIREGVINVIIHNDLIYYTTESFLDLMVYDINSKTHTRTGIYGYKLSMAINRKESILYLAEYSSSTSDLFYFDLKTKEVISKKSVDCKNATVRFDGNFVHFGRKIYDKDQIVLINRTDYARIYELQLTKTKTIFDNDEISIYVRYISSTEIQTVVYDLETSTILYTLSGNASNAYLVGDTIVLINNYNNIVKTVNLK